MGLFPSKELQPIEKKTIVKQEKPITNGMPTYKYVNIKQQYKNRHVFKTNDTISISNGKDLSIEHLPMTGEDAII